MYQKCIGEMLQEKETKVSTFLEKAKEEEKGRKSRRLKFVLFRLKNNQFGPEFIT